MAAYNFYGWETADIKDERGLTPRDYYDLLSEIYDYEKRIEPPPGFQTACPDPSSVGLPNHHGYSKDDGTPVPLTEDKPDGHGRADQHSDENRPLCQSAALFPATEESRRLPSVLPRRRICFSGSTVPL